ncbi:ROK family protein [Solirubrobacter phytolaccae]|uniref:ROK family protein n=1 Tax=Solirubrobacter phytolaccae TaxID=1404360 RepID=A0A9X3S8Q3_9ACTN|nr:ROK family protein [Solirubrobacter phytolaccae]MDA0180591.1 ROK family protein [Solirubrobacter phytolaccae]
MFEAPAGAGAVLRLIRAERATTRSQLTLRTGLSRSTLAERVHSLVTLGLVNEADGPSTGGRPPATLEFNPTAGVVLAATLRPNFCQVVVCNLGATPVFERTYESAMIDPAAVRTYLQATLEHAQVPAQRVWAVGIGVDSECEQDLRDALPHLHDAPVLVDRHVNLRALAEQWTHWRAVDHLLYVSVGTTIECGIVSGGRVHQGARGTAGGLGHIGVPGHAHVPCACGNTGCLEAVVGGRALAEQLRAAGLEASSPADVAALARSGSADAARAVRSAGRAVGEVLAACINFYNPGAIVLGGELAVASQHLLAGLRETAFARSLPMATRDLVVSPTRLGEDAGTTGAAVMAIEHVLAEAYVDRVVQRRDNGV